MKTATMLTLVFACVIASIFTATNELIISTKVLTPDEVNQVNNDIFKNNQDQYATLLSIENMPYLHNIELKIERPLLRSLPQFKNRKYDIEQTLIKESLQALCVQLGHDKPGFFICSPGYFPGEEVNIVLECKGLKSKLITLYPHPVILSSREDNACIMVHLSKLELSTYNFKFDGFQEGEKIKYTSFSCGELLSGEFEIKDNVVLQFVCGVVGFEGGFDNIRFTRNNGEVLEVTLPWGTDLINYLYSAKETIVQNR